MCRTLLQQFFFGTFTASFAFLAYRFTKEKFRLDLYDKRWKFYENLISCLFLISQLSFSIEVNREELYEKINNSFRGIGFHSAYFLFSDDIGNLLNKINTKYSNLLGNPNKESELINESKCADSFINESKTLFKKYMDFSQY